MIMCSINELKIGLKIIQNNEPCVIVNNECIKPGKGQSFNRVKCKQIISGKILEKTFKSGDMVTLANVLEMNLVYVYRDGDLWYFMDEKKFDEIVVSSKIVGRNMKWITNQSRCIITLWNDIPISVISPHYVKLKVIKTDSIIKNVTASSGNKLAVVHTGAVIKVPFFIQIGDWIKINTRLEAYVSRVK